MADSTRRLQFELRRLSGELVYKADGSLADTLDVDVAALLAGGTLDALCGTFGSNPRLLQLQDQIAAGQSLLQSQ